MIAHASGRVAAGMIFFREPGIAAVWAPLLFLIGLVVPPLLLLLLPARILGLCLSPLGPTVRGASSALPRRALAAAAPRSPPL